MNSALASSARQYRKELWHLLLVLFGQIDLGNRGSFEKGKRIEESGFLTLFLSWKSSVLLQEAKGSRRLRIEGEYKMKHLLQVYVRPYLNRIVLGLIIKFTGTIMDLFLPWILAYMIDTVIPEKNKEQLALWGLIMLGCSFLALAGNISANRRAAKVSGEIVEELRHDLFEKIMYLPGTQIDHLTKSALISRLTSDSYNVHNMLSRIQRLGVRAPILLLGGIVMTITLDLALASVLLCLLPVLGVIIWYVTSKGMPEYTRTQEALDGFVRLVREDIAGIRVIKALSKTEYEEKRFDYWNRQLVERERKAGMIMTVLNPAMNLILNLGLVLVIILGAYRVHTGTGEVGTILAFLTYFTIILTAMLSISKMFTIYSKGQASAERITQILKTEDERQLEEKRLEDWAGEEKEPPVLDEGDMEAYVSSDNVSFSYHPGKPVLKNISFSLKKGETLGIIGETGAGKSTIVSLLLGFYAPDSGKILLGGEDIKDQSFGRLRQRVGVVFQNDTLFEGTIYDNIDLGRGLRKEQIDKAIRAAQAEEFVGEKGGQTQGLLNIRGANLSGGQKQRILIARALAAQPDILILDDSSSALDYQTDMRLREAIRKEYKNVTCILIAQRISSVRFADHILVLEEGQALGCGTHEELMAGCRVYRELYQIQTGREETDDLPSESARAKEEKGAGLL